MASGAAGAGVGTGAALLLPAASWALAPGQLGGGAIVSAAGDVGEDTPITIVLGDGTADGGGATADGDGVTPSSLAAFSSGIPDSAGDFPLRAPSCEASPRGGLWLPPLSRPSSGSSFIESMLCWWRLRRR